MAKVPIYEPNLDKLFLRNIEAGRLEFTTDLKAAVDHADIIFLALPTPPDEDGSADLSYVLGVADQLGKMMTSYKVVVDKSTVPVGTADKVREAIAANATVEFDVVSNPEFLARRLRCGRLPEARPHCGWMFWASAVKGADGGIVQTVRPSGQPHFVHGRTEC